MELIFNNEKYEKFIQFTLCANHLVRHMHVNSIKVPHHNHVHEIMRVIKIYEIPVKEGTFQIYHGSKVLPLEWRWARNRFILLNKKKYTNTLGYKNYHYNLELDHLVFWKAKEWEVSDQEFSGEDSKETSENTSIADTELYELDSDYESETVSNMVTRFWEDNEEKKEYPSNGFNNILDDVDDDDRSSYVTCETDPTSCSNCPNVVRNLEDEFYGDDEETDDEDDEDEAEDVEMEMEEAENEASPAPSPPVFKN